MRETSVRLLILFSDLHVKHAIIHWIVTISSKIHVWSSFLLIFLKKYWTFEINHLKNQFEIFWSFKLIDSKLKFIIYRYIIKSRFVCLSMHSNCGHFKSKSITYSWPGGAVLAIHFREKWPVAKLQKKMVTPPIILLYRDYSLIEIAGDRVTLDLTESRGHD
jgi:hypothetical protein